MGIPMLKTRQSQHRLIFNIGIPILVRWHLYIDTTPWSCASSFRWCVKALHHEGPVSYCGMTGITGWHVGLATDGLQWLEAEYQSLTLEMLSDISQNLISHCKCHVISKHICMKGQEKFEGPAPFSKEHQQTHGWWNLDLICMHLKV